MGHLTEERALQALDDAWAAFHLAYARTTGARLHQDEDCLWYESDIGFAVFGGVLRARFAPADADRRIGDLRRALDGRPHHWFVMPTSQPTDLAGRLLHAGAEPIVELGGMAMEMRALAPAPPLPPGIEVRPVTDVDSVRAYARLYAKLFEAPTEGWVEDLADAESEIFRWAGDPFHRYMAWAGERAVAAGMTCYEDGVASLETLSTVPEWRGRGIGAALATQALQNERETGAEIAVVWSSPGAQGLYRRMGFLPVCTGKVFSF